MLVEFASVIDAVVCAINIQRSMAKRNAGILPERKSYFESESTSATLSSTATIFWRRRQYRGASGDTLRARRRMHFEGGKRADSGQAFDSFCRSRRANSEEHLARGWRVRAYSYGYPKRFRNLALPHLLRKTTH